MEDTNYVVSSKLADVKTVSSTPANFRLARKQDGTIILQGAFVCSEGFNKLSWLEWRDLDTVDHETSLPLVKPSVTTEAVEAKELAVVEQSTTITDTDRLNYVFSLNRTPSTELLEIELALLNGKEVDMKIVRAAIDVSIKAGVQEPSSNETLYSVKDGDYIIYDGKTLAECRAFIVSEIEDALAIYDELAFSGSLEPVSKEHLFDAISKLDENSVHDLHVNDATTGGQYARAFAIVLHRAGLLTD
jgi:hypothetical protein